MTTQSVPDELSDALTSVWEALDTIRDAAARGVNAERLGSYTDEQLAVAAGAAERLTTAAKIVRKYTETELLGRHRKGWALTVPGAARVSVVDGTPIVQTDIRQFVTAVACRAYPTVDGTPVDAVELPAPARQIVNTICDVLGASTSLKKEALVAAGYDPAEYVQVVGRRDPTLNVKEK